MKPYFAPLWRQVALWRAALPWVGTPFAERQRLQGVGVDCVQLAAGIYIPTGLVDRFNPGDYAMDGGTHQDRSRVFEWLEKSPAFVQSHEPLRVGDLLAFSQGRAAWHVAITLVVDGADAICIHCLRTTGTALVQLADPTWSKRLVAVYTPIER